MTAVNLNAASRADARGWGPGWPHCQTDKATPLKVSGVSFPGGVREEVHDLMVLLLTESERRKYITLHPGWCWAWGCRPIKNPDGTLTNTPSNHSWGLALDLNAPENGFGASTHKIPAAMAKLWNRYGFRWGGDYAGTKDWMHFEFMGTPAQARALTKTARKELDDVALTNEQKVALEFAIGVQRFAEDKPEPKRNGARRRGWLFAREAAKPKKVSP